MEYRIILDPSHGGTDPGLVYAGRQEKDDVLRLALATGERLEARGIQVVYTRTMDTYHSPFERVEMANNSGADLLLSIHRRAKRSEMHSLGMEHVVYDNTGIPAALVNILVTNLSKLGYRDLGTTEKPSLVLLRRTKIPVVMTEIGFLDNEEDNRFFDENLEMIAEELADGIFKVLTQEAVEPQVMYRIQTGAYRNEGLADQQLMQLRNQGFPAAVIFDDDFYRVLVGAFGDIEAAAEMERILRLQGYNTFITTL